MLHWEFKLPSPLGDGCWFIDFGFERMSLTAEQHALLEHAFFSTGFVGFSTQGRGWLFFSAGEGGLPELALAAPEQVEALPHLPADWENFARVDLDAS